MEDGQIIVKLTIKKTSGQTVKTAERKDIMLHYFINGIEYSEKSFLSIRPDIHNIYTVKNDAGKVVQNITINRYVTGLKKTAYGRIETVGYFPAYFPVAENIEKTAAKKEYIPRPNFEIKNTQNNASKLMVELQAENETKINRKNSAKIYECTLRVKTDGETEYFGTINILAFSRQEATDIYRSIFITKLAYGGDEKYITKILAYPVYNENGNIFDEFINENARFIVGNILRNMLNGATTAGNINFIDTMYRHLYAGVSDSNIDDLLSEAKLALIEMKNKPVYMAIQYAFCAVNQYVINMKWCGRKAKCPDIPFENIENSIDVSYLIDELKKENSILLKATAYLYKSGKLTDTQAKTLFDYFAGCTTKIYSTRLSMRDIAKKENINVSSVYKRLAQARYKIARYIFQSKYCKYLPVDIQVDKDYILNTLEISCKKRNTKHKK